MSLKTIFKSIFLFSIIFTALILLSCKDQTEETNLFDARDIKAGDIIAGMKVEFIEIYPDTDPENEESYLATVRFSGKATLTGKYISYLDQPLLGRSILFYPDEKSKELLPRLSIDEGEVWLQIENYETAVDLLGKPDSEGFAAIVIENYTINYSLEVVYTARIMEVIEKTETVAPIEDKTPEYTTGDGTLSEELQLENSEEVDLGSGFKSKVDVYQKKNENGLTIEWYVFLGGTKRVSMQSEEGRYSYSTMDFDDIDNDGIKEVLLYLYSSGTGAEQYLIIYKVLGEELREYFTLMNTDYFDDNERFTIKYTGNYQASFYDSRYDLSTTINLEKENYSGSEELLKSMEPWVDPVSWIDIIDIDSDGKKEILSYQKVIGVAHPDIIAFLETEYRMTGDVYNIDSIKLIDLDMNLIEEKKIGTWLTYDNQFDARLSKVGDIIVGMEIISIDITPNPYDKDDYWATVKFKGQTPITGTYKNNADDEFLGDSVSFIIEDSSSNLLPRLTHDTRFAWLTFSNQDLAKETFSPPGSEGIATVVIGNYVINYAPTEVWNTADIVEVIEKH